MVYASGAIAYGEKAKMQKLNDHGDRRALKLLVHTYN